jgi:hypothetical protein
MIIFHTIINAHRDMDYCHSDIMHVPDSIRSQYCNHYMHTANVRLRRR